MSFISELKRRNVIKVAIAYVVTSWLLLQVADVVLHNVGAPDWVFKVILLLVSLGLPIALIFSWVYELTVDGLKKEQDVARSESITHTTGRKLDFTIIGVLAIAVIYLVSDRFYVTDEELLGVQVSASIAVLPFEALSSGEDDNYFADGLTEELLNSLSRLPELQVMARTSSFFFKGQKLSLQEIAARLNVAYIVDGSVRREGDQIRIAVELIRAADGLQLWSRSYDRTLDDVFAVQADIAEHIAEILGVALDEDVRRIMRTAQIRDVDAFIAYQKGVEAYATAHAQAPDIIEPLEIANTYFDRAIESAPGLTSAYVMKADRDAHVIVAIAEGVRDEEYPGEAQATLASLRELYDLALRMSPPGNQRDILDVERTLFSDDWSRLPERIRLAMKPGRCPQMNWTDWFLGPFGWAEQVADKIRETLLCNPMDIVANFSLPLTLVWSGDPEAALEAIAAAENKGLSHPWLDDGRFWALLAIGRADDPRVLGPGMPGTIMPYPRQILREALAGDSELAREMAEAYWSEPGVSAWASLVIAAVVGDRERANELAARIDQHAGSAVAFSRSVFSCFCGAPFDLEIAPNYKAHIDAAGIAWPPDKPIDYPTKTW